MLLTPRLIFAKEPRGYASARILVFGHDALLFETRRLILERAGFQVWTAGEVTEAVQILAKEPIDLFILVSVAPC